MNKFSFTSLTNTLAQYGIALLVFCCVLYFMISSIFKKVTHESDEKIRKKMESIESNISIISSKQDGLMNAIDDLEKDNAYLSGMVVENTEKINQNNRVLNNLKKEYGEKIRNVDNYSVSELDSIFSKKYGTDFYKK